MSADVASSKSNLHIFSRRWAELGWLVFNDTRIHVVWVRVRWRRVNSSTGCVTFRSPPAQSTRWPLRQWSGHCRGELRTRALRASLTGVKDERIAERPNHSNLCTSEFSQISSFLFSTFSRFSLRLLNPRLAKIMSECRKICYIFQNSLEVLEFLGVLNIF